LFRNFAISADSFGLPFLSAYLDSLGANYSHGGNFATAHSFLVFSMLNLHNSKLGHSLLNSKVI